MTLHALHIIKTTRAHWSTPRPVQKLLPAHVRFLQRDFFNVPKSAKAAVSAPR